MRKTISILFSEALGTFFLVFGGCGAIMIAALYPNDFPPIGVPLAFALSIGLMVYILGKISGAHLNPAVTVGLAIARRFSWKMVIPYVIAQSLGALIASALLAALLPNAPTLGVTAPSVPVFQAIIWEAILTGILIAAVLCIVYNKELFATSGLLVAAAIVVINILGGPTSGGSVNPARSFGPALIAGDFSNFWIYVVGPLIGAVVTSLVISFLYREKN